MQLEDMEIFIPTRKPPANFKDLTGTENDYFRFISRAPNGPNYRTRWNCQCKLCGDYCVKEASNVMRDQGCGCARKSNIGKALRKDLTNKKFGKLTAKEYANKSNSSGNAIWVCQCECGNKCEVDSNNLTTLHTYSCGCIKYSIGVQNILQCLQENEIKYVLEYAIPGEYSGHPYRFDFALIREGDVERLIEFDGEQHYRTTGGWNSQNGFQAIQQRDKIKNEYALAHNIPLVRIPYWERDNITIDLIMSDKYLVRKPGSPIS